MDPTIVALDRTIGASGRIVAISFAIGDDFDGFGAALAIIDAAQALFGGNFLVFNNATEAFVVITSPFVGVLSAIGRVFFLFDCAFSLFGGVIYMQKRRPTT